MKKVFTNKMYGLFFLWIAFQVQAPAFSQSYSYSGSVKDRVTGYFLSGVNIIVTNKDTDKDIVNTTTNSDGYYSFNFNVQRPSNIKITASLGGYKRSVMNYTPEQLKGFDGRIPVIYLDTAIKFVIRPDVPVRQSADQFISTQLQANHILDLPAAYDLLLYLNPDLRGKDSLMSNDKIVFPKMPRISNEIKRQNKEQFKSDKSKDENTQNKLRDTMDKVSRVLADDISNYKIKYSGVTPDSLKLMREYMRMDFDDYKGEISRTSKLKAEGMIQLLSKIGSEHEKIILRRSIQHIDYEKMKLLWEDLSFLLLKSRYNMFVYGGRSTGGPSAKIKSDRTGPSAQDDYTFYDDNEGPLMNADLNAEKESVYDADEVGAFGFIVWSEEITSSTNPDLGKPNGRYVIRYFKPAFADDKNSYQLCSRKANVATANLTRAKYGVEVYDTQQKKYVETLYPFFRTDEAFTNRKYDALIVPDFKEIKYILIRLK